MSWNDLKFWVWFLFELENLKKILSWKFLIGLVSLIPLLFCAYENNRKLCFEGGMDFFFVIQCLCEGENVTLEVKTGKTYLPSYSVGGGGEKFWKIFFPYYEKSSKSIIIYTSLSLDRISKWLEIFSCISFWEIKLKILAFIWFYLSLITNPNPPIVLLSDK